jgi:hypothetical protein
MAVITPTGFPTTVKTLSCDTTAVHALTIGTGDLDSASDFLKLAVLPPGYRLVDFSLSCDEDPDSNAEPTLAGDIGVLNAAGDGLVANTSFAQLTTTQAGTDTGFTVRPSGINLPNVKNTGNDDVYIAIDFTGAAATADACTWVVTATIAPI